MDKLFDVLIIISSIFLKNFGPMPSGPGNFALFSSFQMLHPFSLLGSRNITIHLNIQICVFSAFSTPQVILKFQWRQQMGPCKCFNWIPTFWSKKYQRCLQCLAVSLCQPNQSGWGRYSVESTLQYIPYQKFGEQQRVTHLYFWHVVRIVLGGRTQTDIGFGRNLLSIVCEVAIVLREKSEMVWSRLSDWLACSITFDTRIWRYGCLISWLLVPVDRGLQVINGNLFGL